MDLPNGTTTEGLFASLHWIGDLPAKVAVGARTHPLKTAATIAGVSFLGGAIFGSRVARAIFVAATPVLLNHLLDGPLGEDLSRYLRGAIRGRPGVRPASS